MGIKEVSIGLEQKKYSPKVTAASEKYLEEFGLSAEHLTDDQRKIVFDFIKLRRNGWIISSIMSLVAVVMIITGLMYFRMLTDEAGFLSDLNITDCQNKSHDHKAENESLVSMVLLMGVFGGTIVYSAGSCVWQIIFHCVTVRRKRKVLEAFLPSVRGSLGRAVA